MAESLGAQYSVGTFDLLPPAIVLTFTHPEGVQIIAVFVATNDVNFKTRCIDCSFQLTRARSKRSVGLLQRTNEGAVQSLELVRKRHALLAVNQQVRHDPHSTSAFVGIIRVGANRKKVTLQPRSLQRIERLDHDVGHTSNAQGLVQPLLVLRRRT